MCINLYICIYVYVYIHVRLVWICIYIYIHMFMYDRKNPGYADMHVAIAADAWSNGNYILALKVW
jgi:hypothetical protein